jgi:hypothetical protein
MSSQGYEKRLDLYFLLRAAQVSFQASNTSARSALEDLEVSRALRVSTLQQKSPANLPATFDPDRTQGPATSITELKEAREKIRLAREQLSQSPESFGMLPQET